MNITEKRMSAGARPIDYDEGIKLRVEAERRMLNIIDNTMYESFLNGCESPEFLPKHPKISLSGLVGAFLRRLK